MSSLLRTIFLVFIETLILTTTVKTDGCFENTDIFESYTQYIQPMSLENRIYYDPAAMGDPKLMTTETEQNLPKYVKKTFTCLEEFDGNRMLVEVKDERKNKIYYQCLQFKSLTKYVIRQAKTKLRSTRDKVNCMKDKYVTDEALLMAMDMLKPEPCPIKGGYQMLFHEGEIIKGHCLDSVLTYNPNMRFQCDGHNVIADFGRDCEPPILRRFQKLRGRHLAYLSCVGNWSETENVNSVLLRMRDMPYDLWCIHYTRMNESSDLLSVFMTLDGRCVENAFHDEPFPKKTSLFGHLASYVSSYDPSCSDSKHLDECKENEAKCFETDQCPANCQRCNAKPSMSPCRFMVDAQGTWKTIDGRQDMAVNVTDQSIRVSRYGRFSCRGEADRDLLGKVYPVVQADERKTCMPYYACAHVESPVPGVLNFKLQPAWRHEDTGEPFTCKETDDKIGFVIPASDEKMITMIDENKLKKSSCGFGMALQFPIESDACLLVVEECDGECSVLNIHYDNETCSDHSNLGFEIETDHICYGKLTFEDGVNGLLTYSEFSDRYFCWIYNYDRLFISSPDQCNSERVKSIFADQDAAVTYDPAVRLMKAMAGGSRERGVGDGNGDAQIMPNPLLALLSTGFLLLLSCLRYT